MNLYAAKSVDGPISELKKDVYKRQTFRYNMLKYCERNDIQNGEYIFRSHDYRHTIATCFYDSGVSLQSIRDYLGHDYEEMTEQYIDYMPKMCIRDRYYIVVVFIDLLQGLYAILFGDTVDW